MTWPRVSFHAAHRVAGHRRSAPPRRERCAHNPGVPLVNPSHGDAAMASIDRRYELTGVVLSGSGTYRIQSEELDAYLIPKAETTITPTMLHERGRGIAYTRSPFAYLFTRVS